MPSYRFCRPDDVPLLVSAVNDCWRPHFPGSPAMTVARFREEMKRLDLWPSASMVALEDDDPVAVLIGARRDGEEAQVLRLAARPGDERRGHGSHLLESLAQKLGVLGPPVLAAEAPTDLPAAAAVLAAAGLAAEAELVDWRRPSGATEAPPAELVVPLGLTELLAAVDLDAPAEGAAPLAWERRAGTLRNLGDAATVWAVASPARVEAWAVAVDGGTAEIPERRVLALGTRSPERRALFLDLLLRRLAADGAALIAPKLTDGEVPADWLAAQGFAPARRYRRFALRVDG